MERVAEMLEHVSQHDDVEGLVLGLIPDAAVVDVAHNDAIRPLFGTPGRLGVDLNSNDAAPALHQDLREVARRAADLENGLVEADHGQLERVGVVVRARIDWRLVNWRQLSALSERPAQRAGCSPEPTVLTIPSSFQFPGPGSEPHMRSLRGTQILLSSPPTAPKQMTSVDLPSHLLVRLHRSPALRQRARAACSPPSSRIPPHAVGGGTLDRRLADERSRHQRGRPAHRPEPPPQLTDFLTLPPPSVAPAAGLDQSHAPPERRCRQVVRAFQAFLLVGMRALVMRPSAVMTMP